MKEHGKIKWMKLIRGIFLGILLVLTMTPAALGGPENSAGPQCRRNDGITGGQYGNRSGTGRIQSVKLGEERIFRAAASLLRLL